MLLDILFSIGGLVVLIVAADRLVVAATRLSASFGVSAVLIGAVVVGFGTSVPEFVVSALASARGEIDISMGNVVASNTSNVTLVLGAAAVIAALVAREAVVRREGALMIASVTVLAVVLWDGELARWEALFLVAGLIAALWFLIQWSRGDTEDGGTGEGRVERPPVGRAFVWREALNALVALVATIAAAQVLLSGILGIGDRLGWSAVFLGLITGVGTSLPELAAGIAAARKRESDLILGNVLGSNIFNSLGVAGVAGLIAPGVLTELTAPLLVVMLAACGVAGLFSFTGERIIRWEGLALLAGFATYSLLAF